MDRSKLYTPLANWQTRLIKLLPGNFAEPLKCELHPAAITIDEGFGVIGELESIGYDALSYSWGYPELTASILCNGMTVPVPPAMLEGLRHLRLKSTHRWVWCDAICVNQADKNEKAAQVQKMLLIYVKARKVVAWLGALDSPSRQSLSSALANKKAAAVTQSRAGLELQGVLQEIVQRAWFSRTWVRQEVYGARDLDLQLGELTVGIEQFLELTKTSSIETGRLTSLTSSYRKVEPSRWPVTDTILEELTTSRLATQRFFDVLSENVEFDASDDRDRIYALIGMIQQSPKLQPNMTVQRPDHEYNYPIDYTIETSIAYQNLIKFLINLDRRLYCLQLFRPANTASSLPSWAIDWKTTTVCQFDNFSHQPNKLVLVPRKMYSWNLLPAPQQDLDHHDELHLQGVRLGIVSGPPDFSIIPGDASRDKPKTTSLKAMSLSETQKNGLNTLLDRGELTYTTVLGLQQINDTTDHGLQPAGVVCTLNVQPGDLVVLLHGAYLPSILRPSFPGSHQYLLIGCGLFWALDRHSVTTSPSRTPVSLSPFKVGVELVSGLDTLAHCLEAALRTLHQVTDRKDTQFEDPDWDEMVMQASGSFAGRLLELTEQMQKISSRYFPEKDREEARKWVEAESENFILV
jgi:hypothetical protein